MESVENAISEVLDLKTLRGECPQTPYKFATSVLILKTLTANLNNFHVGSSSESRRGVYGDKTYFW